MVMFPGPMSPKKFTCPQCGEETYGAFTEGGRWGICDSCLDNRRRSAEDWRSDRDRRRSNDDS